MLSESSIGEHQPQNLSEDILTVPNVLTILRLASTPVLGYLIIVDEMPYALALLALSGFTDVLDGWLARKFKSATVFGSIADPAADKALMTVMVGALAWRGLIPLPLVLLIVGRDVALIISAFLIRYRSLPEPKTFSRYWDPRLPSAKVEPTQVSKYNTFLQLLLVAGCTLIASFNDNWRQWWNTRQGLWNDRKEGDELNRMVTEGQGKSDWGDWTKKSWHAFMVVVSITTIWSGSSYLFGSKAVRYLGQRAKSTQEKVVKLRK
ncbi:hypothetical protein CBS101457_003165 [Exobasidium rhododendri]|nr:hypothetical protein CBS101457_003165 [Exobasidium rhododendri]